jgi:hypothetical protein
MLIPELQFVLLQVQQQKRDLQEKSSLVFFDCVINFHIFGNCVFVVAIVPAYHTRSFELRATFTTFVI